MTTLSDQIVKFIGPDNVNVFNRNTKLFDIYDTKQLMILDDIQLTIEQYKSKFANILDSNGSTIILSKVPIDINYDDVKVIYMFYTFAHLKR